MIFLNTQSRLLSRSVVSLSLLALLSVGLLSGCSEESQQKASEAIEDAKDSAKESMEKAQDAVEETVEETYEKAKSLSSVADTPVLLAENTLSGADLYKTCAGCHGATGQGGVGPRLAGRDAEQMLANLKTYREGGQVGPMSSLMTPYVKSYSDADLTTLVAYIGQL